MDNTLFNSLVCKGAILKAKKMLTVEQRRGTVEQSWMEFMSWLIHKHIVLTKDGAIIWSSLSHHSQTEGSKAPYVKPKRGKDMRALGRVTKAGVTKISSEEYSRLVELHLLKVTWQ